MSSAKSIKSTKASNSTKAKSGKAIDGQKKKKQVPVVTSVDEDAIILDTLTSRFRALKERNTELENSSKADHYLFTTVTITGSDISNVTETIAPALYDGVAAHAALVREMGILSEECAEMKPQKGQKRPVVKMGKKELATWAKLSVPDFYKLYQATLQSALSVAEDQMAISRHVQVLHLHSDGPGKLDIVVPVVPEPKTAAKKRAPSKKKLGTTKKNSSTAKKKSG
jgi:hypothetical protein